MPLCHSVRASSLARPRAFVSGHCETSASRETTACWPCSSGSWSTGGRRVPAHALGWRGRGVRPARAPETGGVLSGGELAVVAKETPVEIMEVAAVGDG